MSDCVEDNMDPNRGGFRWKLKKIEESGVHLGNH